jgi:hypothetical protein|tara:strand:+ start:138 stop:914 length:777 start_codon:yes stop_codon:yes gene_type:complete
MKITLLDNKQYDYCDVKSKMYDDSFYYGELNKLALSSSSIKLLADSPKKYYSITKYGQGDHQAFRDGTLIHTLILEPEKFKEFHFVDVASKNAKAYKEARDEFGTVYTSKEKKDAERVAGALLKNDKAIELLKDCEFEIPVLGNVMGMPFRGKADVLGKNRICDIKTTSNIKDFPYSARKYGYDVQVYLYCNLFNVPYSEFTFLVIDKLSLDIGVWNVTEEFYLKGKEKVAHGIEVYKEYFYNQPEPELDNYIIKGTL